MSYSALDIAKYIITFCNKTGNPICNLQLQQILYYIQGYSLAFRNKETFAEEFVARQYGPVVKEVYDFFSFYAAMPIENSFEVEIADRRLAKMIQIVTADKMSIPALDIAEQTRSEAPWRYTTDLFGIGDIIPKDYIKRYFEEKNI